MPQTLAQDRVPWAWVEEGSTLWLYSPLPVEELDSSPVTTNMWGVSPPCYTHEGQCLYGA